VIEVASCADAQACYDSDAYKSAKEICLPAYKGSLVIVEGYDS